MPRAPEVPKHSTCTFCGTKTTQGAEYCSEHRTKRLRDLEANKAKRLKAFLREGYKLKLQYLTLIKRLDRGLRELTEPESLSLGLPTRHIHCIANDLAFIASRMDAIEKGLSSDTKATCRVCGKRLLGNANKAFCSIKCGNRDRSFWNRAGRKPLKALGRLFKEDRAQVLGPLLLLDKKK